MQAPSTSVPATSGESAHPSQFPSASARSTLQPSDEPVVQPGGREQHEQHEQHISSTVARNEQSTGTPPTSLSVPPSNVPVVQKNARWYHGGLASAAAVCFTHPFDLVKVQLQTQQDGKLKILPLTQSIIRQHGFLALYNGISASLLRQLTYSTARFGVYEALKEKDSSKSSSFLMKCGTAGLAGGIGGLIGAPADLINVRMQNDSKLPAAARRNYKNAVEGLVRVSRQEGVAALWRGSSMVVSRAVLMTIGQLAFYDQVKHILLVSGLFRDNVPTHLLASAIAAGAATTITLPVDVLKTRMQNSKPGEYKSILHCVQEVARSGPLGFFKGYIPAFVRLGPQTILTFVFLEQIRMRFGIPVPEKSAK